MEKIFDDILNQIRAEGYDVSGIIGHKYLVGQNSEQAGISLLFEELKWQRSETGIETYSEYPIVLCVPTEVDESQYPLDLFEDIKIVAYLFMNKLRNYTNDNGQQLIQIQSEKYEHFQDYKLMEITCSGVFMTISFTRYLSNQC